MSSYDDLGKASDLSPCANCGTTVDPLRAARVRIFGGRFFHFCSSDCAEVYSPPGDELGPPRRGSDPPRAESDPDSSVVRRTPTSSPSAVRDITTSKLLSDPRKGSSRRADSPDTASAGTRESADGSGERSHGEASPTRPAAPTALSPAPAPTARRGSKVTPSAQPRTPSSDDVRATQLLGVAIGLGLFSLGLLLAEGSKVTTALRVGALVLGNVAFTSYVMAIETRTDRRFGADAALLNWAALLLLIGGLVSGVGGSVASDFAATLLATSAGSTLLLRRLFRPVDATRAGLARGLGQTASRVTGDRVEQVSTFELCPGEEIIVHAGETVAADMTIVAGRAEVYPWFGATTIHSVGPEDFVYAGARLASGQLRATVRWTGMDRHWERLTNDPSRRVDLHSPLVQFARKLAFRGAPALAVLAAFVSFSANDSIIDGAVAALAGASAMLGAALRQLPSLFASRSLLSALGHGIIFRDAAAIDAAGRVSTAVFCARGTLLLGEPELSNIEAVRDLGSDQVLALAAGAQQIRHHSTAVALLRAARARGVTPDAVRSPRVEAGMGVTAVASHGSPLVVGSRALLLRERVSIARAEARITELEAMGRSIVLVAVGGHLVGILALQDGLRGGARAAVQHLLDAGIEPALLSGDARKSCEALGRTIDIEHVRPEVLPSERGREVERLRSGGAQVAVIGRSPADEVALAAASVSIALPSVGTPNMDYDVELATNEVQKAALALRLARELRNDSTQGIALGFGGAIAATLGILAVSAPAALVPLICFGFAVAAITAPWRSSGISAAPR